MANISIVIPTYNKCEELLRPLCESIVANTDMDNVEVIVVSNGSTDNTDSYVRSLGNKFKLLSFPDPLGYTRATNIGIMASSGDYVVLMNNDCVLLPQRKNLWIECLLEPFEKNDKVGITGPLKSFCQHTKREFMIFFCVMTKRSVLDEVGLMDVQFSPGGSDDIDLSIRAQDAGYSIVQVPGDPLYVNSGMMVGSFPIYHAGEATFSGVRDWQDIFDSNSHKLAKKHNKNYRLELTNSFERAVFLKGDKVDGREFARYEWARNNVSGSTILEVGSTSGFGSQFFKDMRYVGVDYEKKISDISRWEFGDENHKFVNADINEFELGFYDNIVAFEIIEHLDNGLELVERLKKHCNNLLITVPYKEPKGFWGQHHKIWGLDESMFKDFEISYIDEHANILDRPNPNTFNLMLMRYRK